MIASQNLQTFLREHKLPRDYEETVSQWFQPLSNDLAAQQENKGRTLLVGINGAQGSGKSTLGELLVFL